jgi:hypothetical protein
MGAVRAGALNAGSHIHSNSRTATREKAEHDLYTYIEG